MDVRSAVTVGAGKDDVGFAIDGSGVVISEDLALTARHVLTDGIWRGWEYWERDPDAREHDGTASICVLGGFDPDDEVSLAHQWNSNRVHFLRDDSKPFSDIGVLELLPRSQPKPDIRYPILNFAVPKRGDLVHIVGFHDPEVVNREVEGERVFGFGATSVYSQGVVVELHLTGRPGLFARVPCVSVEAVVHHGMSGSGVFDDRGRLIGVALGGGTNDGPEAVGLLFPTLAMEIGAPPSRDPHRLTQMTLAQAILARRITATGLTRLRPVLTKDGHTELLPVEIPAEPTALVAVSLTCSPSGEPVYEGVPVFKEAEE